MCKLVAQLTIGRFWGVYCDCVACLLRRSYVHRRPVRQGLGERNRIRKRTVRQVNDEKTRGRQDDKTRLNRRRIQTSIPEDPSELASLWHFCYPQQSGHCPGSTM